MARRIDDSVPVDKETHRVYEDKQGLVYSVMLNQTDIGFGVRGHNKFYQMQIIVADAQRYYLFRKSGRVGAQHPRIDFDQHATAKQAIGEFQKLFKQKTGGNVYGSGEFEPEEGKYKIVDMSHDVEEEDEEMELGSDEDLESDLPINVLNIVELICNKKMQQQALADMNIDVKRMPLGQLSENQIAKGFEILERIENSLNRLQNRGRLDANKSLQRVLQRASNDFYTAIPHDFGMNLPPVIDTIEMLDKRTRYLEDLSSMKTASDLMSARRQNLHPADHCYAKLRCTLECVDPQSQIMKMVSDMVASTHAPTHNQYSLQVEQVFQVQRAFEDSLFQPFLCLPNRQLLWHGSRLTNFAGILSEGLRIAPTEAPKTGYMFGKGLYFADMCSKAANYCKATPKNPYGLLLLCEVALGTEHQLSSAEYLQAPPPPCHSVMGVGKTRPASSGTAHFDADDPNSPLCHSGQPVSTEEDGGAEGGDSLASLAATSELLYNEFIVYDTAQVRIRYMVKCKFNFQDMFD